MYKVATIIINELFTLRAAVNVYRQIIINVTIVCIRCGLFNI